MTGYIIGVSEIMDLGKEAGPIYASEPYNRPCVIA